MESCVALGDAVLVPMAPPVPQDDRESAKVRSLNSLYSERDEGSPVHPRKPVLTQIGGNLGLINNNGPFVHWAILD